MKSSFLSGSLLSQILILLLCHVNHCWGQSTPFIHYSVAEGFPSSETYSVFQDKKGFVWFTTDNGVVRFDGKEMDVFQTEDGLPDPVVFEIVEDKADRLWFRSFSGRLSYFENEKIKLFKHNDSLTKVCRKYFMESLCFGDEDKIWFGNADNISTIDSTGRVLHFGSRNAQNQVWIKSVQNNFVFASNGTRLETIKINNQVIRVSQSGRQPTRKVCRVTWRGENYFSVGSSIYKVWGDSLQLAFKGPDQIISLAIDKSDNLWIGYLNSPLEAYSVFDKKLTFNLQFLQSKSVTGLLQDHQGGYWISTLQDGVYYVPEINFLTLDVDVANKITAVYTFSKGTLVGDDHGQILLLNEKGGTERKTNLCNCTVLTFLYLPTEDLIWVSTSANTYILTTKFNILKKWGQSLSHLLRDRNGEILGVSSIHLLRLDSIGKLLSVTDINKPNRSLYRNSRYLFLFGRTGLQVLTPSLQNLKLTQFLDKTKISNILPLNDSIFICGTQGNGFITLNQNNWKHQEYSLKEKFNAANIYSALDDGSRIWLATEKGIAVAHKKNIIDGNPDFFFITKKNGLPQEKVNFLTQTKDFVWAYFEKSVSRIPKQYDNSVAPIFYPQYFMVNNQPHARVDGEELSSETNNIHFRYRIIDFKNQNIFLRYRLSASDNWSYTKDRLLNFYSLSSGDYSFEIQCSEDNFHWNKAARFSFSVMPPWWKSWRFQVAMAFTVLVFGFVYYRRRITLLRERHNYLKIINEQQQSLIKAELETLDKERGRIAKELHDSVGTNLTAIRMMIHRWFRDHSHLISSDIEDHFQNTIKDLKDIIFRLEPSELAKNGLIAAIQNYSGLIQRNLDINIDLKSEGIDPRELNVNLTSFRILQELLSNSLKHSQASKIAIEIKFSDSNLVINYCDNGRGFAVDSVKRGSGLFNIESRVQAAKGVIAFRSDPNQGVSYRVNLPIIKTASL